MVPEKGSALSSKFTDCILSRMIMARYQLEYSLAFDNSWFDNDRRNFVYCKIQDKFCNLKYFTDRISKIYLSWYPLRIFSLRLILVLIMVPELFCPHQMVWIMVLELVQITLSINYHTNINQPIWYYVDISRLIFLSYNYVHFILDIRVLLL